MLREEIFEKKLAEGRQGRQLLAKKDGELVGDAGVVLAGHYLANYSQCLLNRQIDIFDDAIFLLENDRTASACTISRGMIETYAIGNLFGHTIATTLRNTSGRKSVEHCLETTLRFTNSSRLKVTEQKKVADGVFKLSDYKFTRQAQERMANQLATSEHVMKALRLLYQQEMEDKKAEESEFEFIYDLLSEWVHPSQTSVFHRYVPATHLIPTSRGPVLLHDFAKELCARALHFITYSAGMHDWILELAGEVSARERADG